MSRKIVPLVDYLTLNTTEVQVFEMSVNCDILSHPSENLKYRRTRLRRNVVDLFDSLIYKSCLHV